MWITFLAYVPPPPLCVHVLLSLLPKLPNPKDLRPFPTTKAIEVRSHPPSHFTRAADSLPTPSG